LEFADVSEVLAVSIMRVIALIMTASNTSETSVNFYQTTQNYNPGHTHLHTRRRENLKSHVPYIVYLDETFRLLSVHFLNV
jgi:hypothetical protein